MLKKVKSNDYPIFLLEHHLDGPIRDRYIANKEDYKIKTDLLSSSSNFIMNINQYLVDQLADYQVDSKDYMQASDHVDEMLYSGFTGPSDYAKIKKIDNLNDSSEILQILDTLEDKRMIELYKRKLYSDKRALLTDDQIDEYRGYIADKISNDSDKVPWTTLSKARSELIKASQDERFSNMTEDVKRIEEYLDKLEKNFV